STALDIRLTHSPTSAFTSSGPSRSPSEVDPTTSANSAVTGRSSSPSTEDRAAGPGGAPNASAGTGAPQDGQNRLPAGMRAPPARHVASGAVGSMGWLTW